GREPFRLDRALHVGAVERTVACAVEVLGGVVELLPSRGRSKIVAVLCPEIRLVRGILEQVRAVVEDLRVRPRWHSNERAVDGSLLHQRGEEVTLHFVGEEVVQRSESVLESREPDRVQNGDVERDGMARELTAESVVETVVGELDERDSGAGVLLELLGDGQELAMPAGFN